MRGTTWPLAALLVAAGCGTGTDGKPITPPTSPVPEPPTQPPTVRASAWVIAQPSDSDGYIVGELIQVVLDFEQAVSAEGSPRLVIEIGQHVRLAQLTAPPGDSDPRLQWFEYVVRSDDEDPDGISIAADALDFSEGAFVNVAGVDVQVKIQTVNAGRSSVAPYPAEPGENLARHPVVGTPPRRVCTDERERASRSVGGVGIVDEWDGTPFQVDMVRDGFPDAISESDLERLLEPVALLAQKIEDQLGYRILEKGEVIPAPGGAPTGWNTDGDRFEMDCPEREPGRIYGFFLDDTPESGARGLAFVVCGAFAYVRHIVPAWPPCLECEGAPRLTDDGKYLDAITLHEMLHLLGFNHHPRVDPDAVGLGGVQMSVPLTTVTRPDAEAVLWSDIDLLRCIFPNGG